MAGNNDLANSMLEMMELVAPMREGMKGFRTQLIADGWSEAAAEQIAASLFIDMLHKPFAD